MAINKNVFYVKYLPDDVFIDDFPLWRLTNLAQLTSGAFYIDYAANRVYLADAPFGHTVELAVATRAILGYSTSQIGDMVAAAI